VTIFAAIIRGTMVRFTMNPLERLYYIGYSIKKSYALKNQKKLPIRVISIGNITVGGTGKTPATIAIAEEAKRRGFLPCILTRGYRGGEKGPCFVSRGEEPLLGEREAGDEPLLMAERLKGVPIVKGTNRYEAGLFALSALPLGLRPDIFILDDGFQHWRLFRDRNILLIDGTNPFGNRRLFPLGPLREPLIAINRADIIVITKQKPTGNDLLKEIRKYNASAPVFFAEHNPSKFITGHGDTLPLTWAKDRKFYGFCGIGNPESFRKTLLSAGMTLIGFKAYRDHYRYRREHIERIRRDAEKSGAHWIVTTEKDIMRLRGFSLPENTVVISIDFVADGKLYEEVFK